MPLQAERRDRVVQKNLTITVLLDFYGELLTKKQAEAMKLYYDEDCSLSEIADSMGISRQGARDFIKRGEVQLCEFEEKLRLAERFMKITAAADRLIECAKGEKLSDEMLCLIEQIRNSI